MPQVVEPNASHACALQRVPSAVSDRVLVWRLIALSDKQPTVLARWKQLDVAGENLHQRTGEEYCPLRPVLRRTDLDGAAVNPLDLARDGQRATQEVNVVQLNRRSLTESQPSERTQRHERHEVVVGSREDLA